MVRRELVDLLRRSREWVQASASGEGAPQAAVVGVAVGDALEIAFDTLATSRKCKNLRQDPRIALVMFHEARTVQIEGVATEPSGGELARIKRIYFATFPDGVEREAWADITYFVVRPVWIRVSDFAGAEPVIEEISGAALAALLDAP